MKFYCRMDAAGSLQECFTQCSECADTKRLPTVKEMRGILCGYREPQKWEPYKAPDMAAHWIIVGPDHTPLFTCWRGESDARYVCDLHNSQFE